MYETRPRLMMTAVGFGGVASIPFAVPEFPSFSVHFGKEGRSEPSPSLASMEGFCVSWIFIAWEPLTSFMPMCARLSTREKSPFYGRAWPRTAEPSLRGGAFRLVSQPRTRLCPLDAG
jgi:hypothetical protein